MYFHITNKLHNSQKRKSMLVCRHITEKSKNKNSYRASGSSMHACVYVCARGWVEMHRMAG